MANRFKEPGLRKMYDTCMKLARDPNSEFYVSPNGIRVTDKEGRNRRTGASHRCEFFAGYDGINPAWGARPGTLGYAAYRAGVDYRKEEDRI